MDVKYTSVNCIYIMYTRIYSIHKIVYIHYINTINYLIFEIQTILFVIQPAAALNVQLKIIIL